MSESARSPARIAVFHLNQLGDLVFSLPALRALRAGFPDARIVSVLRRDLAPLLSGTRLVDELVTHGGARDFVDTAEWLRALAPELTVGMSESPRSRLLGFLSGAPRRCGLDGGLLAGLLTEKVEKIGPPSCRNNLRLVRRLGCPVEQESYVGLLDVGAGERDLARSILASAGWPEERRRLVVLAPAVSEGRERKRWPAERFAEVARRIGGFPDAAAVVVGAEVAREAVPTGAEGCFDLSGHTDLRQLAGLLAGAELFVGNDSGVLHLAACLGLPCVALFGPTDPSETGPHGTGHVVLRAAEGDMSGISTERVLAAVEGGLVTRSTGHGRRDQP